MNVFEGVSRETLIFIWQKHEAEADHEIIPRWCRTASVQSTEMAERVYAAVGFRDLGQILEYVP